MPSFRQFFALALPLPFLIAALSCRRAEPPQPFKPLAHTFEAPAQRDTFLCPRILSTQSYALKGCVPDPCTKGDVPVEGVPGACCAEGQTFDEQKLQCVGEGRCPAGMTSGSQGCYFKDHAQDTAYDREQCEEHDNLRACHAWAEAIATSRYVPREPLQARAISERACARGHMESCALLAYLYVELRPVKPAERERAEELNRLSCQAGSSRACLSFAFDKEKPGYEEKPQRAMRLCELTGQFCLKARSLEPRDEGITEQDREDNATLEKLCLEERDVSSCRSYIYLNARVNATPSEQVFETIAPALKAWCTEGQAQACELVLERSSAPEVASSVEALMSACEQGGDFDACVSVERHARWEAKNEESQIEREALFALMERSALKGCVEGQRGKMCDDLAVYYHEKGELERALDLYMLACDAQQMEACSDAADLLYGEHAKSVSSETIERAQHYGSRACMATIPKACYRLGKSYYFHKNKALSEPQNYARSAEIFKHACHEFGQQDSCYFLGANYRYAQGVSRDQEKAELYTAAGCLLGRTRSCFDVLVYTEGTLEELFETLRSGAELMASYPAGRQFNESSDPKRWDPHYASKLLYSSMFAIERAAARCAEWAKKSTDCEQVALRASGLLETHYQAARLDCEAGDASACLGRGAFSYHSVGPIAKDPEEYLPYYERACELGKGGTCWRLSTWRLKGLEGAAQDLGAARDLSLKSCAHLYEKYPKAPPGNGALRTEDFFVGRLLSPLRPGCERALWLSAHLDHDLPGALKVVNETCQAWRGKNFPSQCEQRAREMLYELAAFYPETLSAHVFKARCEESGEAKSCAIYARALWESDPKAARSIAERACEHEQEGEGSDCSELGRQLLATPDDQERGRELLARECERTGDPWFYGGRGCVELGEHLLNSELLSERAKGREMLERGCDAINARSCSALARLLLESKEIDPDPEKAKKLFSKACNRFDYEACLQ